MENKIQVLDCTLRDGGLGLEDANKNSLSSIKFSVEDIAFVSNKLADSCIDIVELGAIEITEDDRTGFAIYQSIERISRMIPKNRKPNQLFAALFRGPDTPIEDIPDWNPSLCEVVRVIIRYSEMQKSLDFCSSLTKKGYKVFVQPMLTMRYTDSEIDLLINETNKMNAYALYFVDSYGYMQKGDIKRLFERYDKTLHPEIRIGFHAHNNMDLAFSNVLEFIEISHDRKIVVDSCLMGMGQGAGNLQTELLIGYLNESSYNFDSILDACELIEKYNIQTLWGYSVTRLLPAIHRTAYKYAIVLRFQYKFSYSEINMILSQIPEELKQRYTPENTATLLKVTGFGHKLVIEE
ncbi:MAG: hypothetical protein IKK33_12745 [Lachnospiraceae bacterium]|nr:hypothetical protein [Lachnospiraceae bacterium]